MFRPESKILIVEDMNSIRDVVVNAFKELGFTYIFEAKDIGEAWDKIQGEPRPFDLVVCNLIMAKTSGMDLLVRIRKSERFKKLPFLMTSNKSDQKVILSVINAGADHFLVKPFQIAELADKLKKIHEKSNGGSGK